MDVLENKKVFAKKIIILNIGFFLCSLGMIMMLTAGLGAGPWVTFHKGLSILTGLSFGRMSQIVGLIIILVGAYLNIAPGIGTILNMFFIGFYADVIEASGFLVTPLNFPLQLLLLVGGMIVNSFGIYVYLINGLGAGPRDGLMLGLVKKTNLSVTVIKSSIEITALLLGIFLGGPYGIGTVIAALGMGYILNTIFNKLEFDAKTNYQRTLKDEWEVLKKFKVKNENE